MSAHPPYWMGYPSGHQTRPQHSTRKAPKTVGRSGEGRDVDPGRIHHPDQAGGFVQATEAVSLKQSLHHVASKGNTWLRETDQQSRWDLANLLSKALRDGSYRPARIRRKAIPKASGGTRYLSIPSPVDRAIGRSILQVVQPLLESQFSAYSYGFRRGHGRMHALVHAEYLTREENRRIWVQADIKDAFDSIPRNRLADLLDYYILEEELAELIKTMALPVRKKGINQGGPLSPFLANLYFHHFLDQPWSRHRSNTPLLRYADDLLIPCVDRQEAEDCQQTLQELIQNCGLTLKTKVSEQIIDLSESPVTWLGFRISLLGRKFQFDIPNRVWCKWDQELSALSRYPDFENRTWKKIASWIPQYGALSLESVPTVYTRLKSCFASHGLVEFPELSWFSDKFQHSTTRFLNFRREFRRDQKQQKPHGFADANASEPPRAVNDSLPVADPARGSSSGGSQSFSIWISANCPTPGHPGDWSYRIEDSQQQIVAERTDQSAKTSLRRMNLLAILRALEQCPEGQLTWYLPPNIAQLIHNNFVPSPTEDWPVDLLNRLRTGFAPVRHRSTIELQSDC